MSHSISISAQIRTGLGKEMKALRVSGSVPAVVYGRGFQNQNIQVLQSELLKLGNQLSSSVLFDVKLPDESFQVLLQDYQKNVISGEYTHLDFLRVNQNEKITAEVPVQLTGESPVVKELGGVLVTGIHAIEVRCLPADLPENLTVDLGQITEFNTPIHVSDIKLSDKVEIMTSADSVIASVTHLKAEEAEGATGPSAIIPDSVKEEAKVANPDKEKKGKEAK